MKIRCGKGSPSVSTDILVVVLAGDDVEPEAGPALRTAIAAAKATGDLKTAFRSTALFHPAGKGAPRRLGFVGLGKPKDLDTEKLRRAAAVAQALAEDAGAARFLLCVGT